MKNITRFALTPAGQVVIVGVAAIIYLRLAEKRVKKTANAINPVSEENIFYQGVNGVGGAVTGDNDFDLGHWIYDTIHGVPEP